MKNILLILFLVNTAYATDAYDGNEYKVNKTYTGSFVGNVTGAASLNVLKAGDTMTGQLTNTSSITITGTAFSVGGSTLAVAYGTVAIGKAPNNAIVLDVYDGATRSGINIAAGGVNGTYYPLVAKNSGGTRGVWIRDNGYTGINVSAPSAELVISSVAAATDTMCFLGARDSLPTTGYARGCIVYLTSDPTKIYLSTETVVGTQSWLAK
jgi:hypothetical protein